MRKSKKTPVVRASCLAIFTAGESTGDGTYTVDVDGAGPSAPFQVRCDMANGGWTLIMTSSSADRTDETAVQTQTTDCTSLTAFCNVSSKAWSGYTNLRQTWSGCAGAYAQISAATFSGDSGACHNTADSLLMSWSGSGVSSGMKTWNDCGASCGGQTRFAGNFGGGTLWSSSHFIGTTTGLSTSAGACAITNYHCPTGSDSIWIK